MLIRFISWNVNGLRALLKKPEWDWLMQADAQILALQETKATPDQLPPEVANRSGWHSFWDSSVVKKGYSGVAVFTRLEPLKVITGLADVRYQGEGRLLHIEFPAFHFFNGYFPNGGAPELDENGKPTGRFKRVPYKLGFFEEFLREAVECQKTKPVVVCGDFNIAHEAIDLIKPKEHEQTSGFLPEERAWMDKFIKAGFVDTFRHVHGQLKDQYTWWSYQGFARRKNQGWRIDYFFVSDSLAPNIREAGIMAEIKGSDHCPVSLALEM